MIVADQFVKDALGDAIKLDKGNIRKLEIL